MTAVFWMLVIIAGALLLSSGFPGSKRYRRHYDYAGVLLMFGAVLVALSACSPKPPVASPSDVAAAARPAELPDVSDLYATDAKPARPVPLPGNARVTEGQVARWCSQVEAVADQCTASKAVIVQTYEKARQLSRAVPPQE